MALRNKGEVPFPQMGERAFLCFTLADIGELEQKYGVGEYLSVVDANIQDGSGSTVLFCLKLGLKQHDAAGKRKRIEFGDDDIDFPITEAHIPIMDALCLSIANKDYAETIAEIEKRSAEIAAAAKKLDEDPKGGDDPLPVSAASSATKQ